MSLQKRACVVSSHINCVCACFQGNRRSDRQADAQKSTVPRAPEHPSVPGVHGGYLSQHRRVQELARPKPVGMPSRQRECASCVYVSGGAVKSTP